VKRQAKDIQVSRIPTSALDVKKQYERKLKHAAQRIREEAKGKLCGDCCFWSRGACPYVMPSVIGESSEHRADAVACKRWEPVAKKGRRACGG
jgi:hypothetical protein